MARMRLLFALSLSLFVGVTSAGCSAPAPAPSSSVSSSSGIDLKPDTTGAGQLPGALFSATSLPTIDRRLKSETSLAAQIAYTSKSGITGELTEVTGTVFVPAGTAPQGGWPIVVYAHS